MANHKSALKRASQNEARRLRNKAVKTKVKNTIKNLCVAFEEKKEKETINEMLNIAKSIISKAVKKGVLHKKTASRKVSKLSKAANFAIL